MISLFFFFFFKQKTAYEITASDWSSDVCSSDLVIKAIQPAVLVAIGDCKRLKRFLVCTGGKEFIGQAVQLTGKLAAAVEASVTLLHVMAEPPAIYADLVSMEEDVDRLLESRSELGRNLLQQKKRTRTHRCLCRSACSTRHC